MFPLIPLLIKEAINVVSGLGLGVEVSINSTSYKRSDAKLEKVRGVSPKLQFPLIPLLIKEAIFI